MWQRGVRAWLTPALSLSAHPSSPWCVLYSPLWQGSSHFHQWPWRPRLHSCCLQSPQGTSPVGPHSGVWTRHRCSHPCSYSAGQPCVADKAWSAGRLSVQEVRPLRGAVSRAHPGHGAWCWGPRQVTTPIWSPNFLDTRWEWWWSTTLLTQLVMTNIFCTMSSLRAGMCIIFVHYFTPAIPTVPDT